MLDLPPLDLPPSLELEGLPSPLLDELLSDGEEDEADDPLSDAPPSLELLLDFFPPLP